MRNFLTIIIFCNFIGIQGALAQSRIRPISNGMTGAEVLERWGQPKDRLERETKRRQVWIYDGEQEATFENGKVISFHESDAAQPVVAAPVEPEVKENIVNQDSSSDLVREIAKELPSGPDVVSQDSTSPEVMPVPQNQFINQVPQPPGFQGLPQQQGYNQQVE